MANYKLISAGSGKCLNIYGSGQASNHRNVCLWSDSGTKEQQWGISTLSGNTRVLSVLNTAYGLNIWRGSDNMNNCDIYPVSGNEKDSLITVDAVNGNYRFKMTNYNLYLTAKGSANGSDVRWEAWTGSTNQQWKAVGVGPVDPPVTGDYQWPTVSKGINQHFYVGPTDDESHYGVDISATTKGKAGDPIYAFASGKVVRVFNWDTTDGTSGNNSMGNALFIDSGNPIPNTGGNYLRTMYMHMNAYPTLPVGTPVKKGQVIGYMGTSGRSSGVHLHFGIKANKVAFPNNNYLLGTWVNPNKYFSWA